MRFLRHFRALALAVGLASCGLAASPARADTTHVVGRGETLYAIAKRYRVTPEAIRSANGLREKQLIHPGLSLTIPGVSKGGKDADSKAKGKEKDRDADAKPAKGKGKDAKDAKGKDAKNKDADDDADADTKGKSAKGKGAKDAKDAKGKDAKGKDAKGKDAKLASDAKGKDAKDAKGKDAKAKSAKDAKNSASSGSYAARPKKAGFVTMVRGTEKLSAQVLTRGQLNRASLPGLTKILRHVASDAKKPVDPRLAYLIGLVSDHFGGRTIHVVSGYRPYSKKQYTPHSNHNLGRAMDFMVEGVPNTVVRDYCRTFRDAGVGYYPNSTFVHLDVRTGKAYWIDYSGPGEPPRYDAKAKGKADESARDVEGNEPSGGSGETQAASKQSTETKKETPDLPAVKTPVAKTPGLKTPSPSKTDSPTPAQGVSDDPYR